MPDPNTSRVARLGTGADQRRRARPPSRPRRAVLAGMVLVAAVLATAWRPSRPLLLWNESESIAPGLYRVWSPSGIRPGDTVVAWPPQPVRLLAAERRYLPSGIPLVKQVAGFAGDRVCAAGHALFVNGRLAVLRQREDGLGRPLPWWEGCIDIGKGELLLLLPDVPGSFDGRYFGVTDREDVIGRARLIWAR